MLSFKSVVLFWPVWLKEYFYLYETFEKGGRIVISNEKKSWAEELLRQKYNELGRLPKPWIWIEGTYGIFKLPYG